ncbi:MAG: ABC transporter ATP-binding protein [Anaerolineae bacterium]|nr:ABC transporter ATP-binding protein [Anaerolineae bacterium]MDW8100807.1 ABC transporter ATP-binding protein [Anaerolineae bacterium]
MQDQVHQAEPLLEVKGLKKYFPIERGFLRRVVGYVKAVDDVSFHIMEGETLGLVGESGCGKTTVGRSILRAIPPTSGQVLFRDPVLGRVDVSKLDAEQLRQVRRSMRMMFQDPYTSLNPRMTLLDIVGAPLRAMNIAKGKELEERVAELLRLVGLPPEYMRRYPHAFSGGQRQRIALARALAPNPKFVVCDEPVSALDVSVQAQILNLLKDLQEQLGLTYLFIAHDLSVVAHISDRVAVMYVGKLVEMAPTAELFASPKHPYTEALMSAIPRPDPRPREKRVLLTGEVANPANPPSGCYFHPRCLYAQEICRQEDPLLEEISPGHYVRCHRARELTLTGAVTVSVEV